VSWFTNLVVKAAPGADGDKYRKIKMKNDKIEGLILKQAGALELLLAVGFEEQMIEKEEGMEPYLVFDSDSSSITVAERVLQQWT